MPPLRQSASLENPIDIVCLGIGENGHLAFNDPHVAFFDDPLEVKVVELDDACRRQQVNDECFETFDEVPETALTLTIPTLHEGQKCVLHRTRREKGAGDLPYRGRAHSGGIPIDDPAETPECDPIHRQGEFREAERNFVLLAGIVPHRNYLACITSTHSNEKRTLDNRFIERNGIKSGM
jgi:hypothetical protein